MAPLVLGKAPTHVLLGHGAHSCFAMARGPLRRQRTWGPSYFSGKGTPTHTYGSLLLPPTWASLGYGRPLRNASLEHGAHFRFPGAWHQLRQYWEHGAAHMSLEQGAQFLGSLGQGAHSSATWAQGFARASPHPLMLHSSTVPFILTPGNASTNASPGHRAHSYLAGARCPLRLWLGSSTSQFGE